VLTLAFGKEYRQNIDEVYRIVEQRRSRIEGDAARAVASPHRLLEVLARRPVAHDVVQAAIQRGGRDVALGLLDAMADPDFPSHGRHAAAYIIQRLLELPAPPIDPETEAVLTRPELLTLRGLTRKQIAR